MRSDPLGRPLLERARQLTAQYSRFDRTISSISLVGGFVFDAVTLKRVDMFWENFWVVVHILAIALCIVGIHRQQSLERAGKGHSPKLAHWLVNILQFFFGGLLSTFMVFYFRSGTFWVSWPFYLLLGTAFVANERLKSSYARLDFQLGLFFLSLFCFTIFILPIALHATGRLVFLLSGAVSLALLWLFLRVLRRFDKEAFTARKWVAVGPAATIFIVINALYFLNFIPPLPLSLQEAGVYHSIMRRADGNYLVQSEKQGWLRFFRLVPTFHLDPGTPVYFYSAVFSPTSLNTGIVHEWQTYDRRRGWTTADRIALSVRGGRDGGYRTYSMTNGVRPGAWRVNVETPAGAILGRFRFNISSESAALTSLVTELKD